MSCIARDHGGRNGTGDEDGSLAIRDDTGQTVDRTPTPSEALSLMQCRSSLEPSQGVHAENLLDGQTRKDVLMERAGQAIGACLHEGGFFIEASAASSVADDGLGRRPENHLWPPACFPAYFLPAARASGGVASTGSTCGAGMAPMSAVIGPLPLYRSR